MHARYYDADLGPFISEDPSGFAGYGNGPYSSYYATKRAAEAANRDDYAKLSAQIGDALTIATPVSGALAPSIATMATGFAALSMALSHSKA